MTAKHAGEYRPPCGHPARSSGECDCQTRWPLSSACEHVNHEACYEPSWCECSCHDQNDQPDSYLDAIAAEHDSEYES